eukprot:1903044-Ditylum_brightwellii.AAC.1
MTEMIKERGEQLVETEERFKTNVQFEWVIPKGTKPFNIRTTFIKTITVMKKIDTMMYTQSTVSNIWKEMTEYLLESNFTMEFEVKQVYSSKGTMKVKLFRTILSKL